MIELSLFDAGPPDPGSDAAPRLGSSGASVRGSAKSRESTPKHRPSSLALRHDAPETSREAAAHVAPHVGRQQAAVLAFIASCGEHGATDAEVSEATGIPIQSINPRRGELAGFGLIVLAGRKRPTATGCGARVWVAKEYAPTANGGAA